MDQSKAEALRHGRGYRFKGGGMYPAKAYQVIDVVTGEPERIGENKDSFVWEESEAVEYIASVLGWENRLIIVKINALRYFPDKRDFG